MKNKLLIGCKIHYLEVYDNKRIIDIYFALHLLILFLSNVGL